MIKILSEAIKMLTDSSKGRTQAVQAVSGTETANGKQAGNGSELASPGGCEVEEMLRDFQGALAEEMAVCLGLLAEEEGKANAAAAAVSWVLTAPNVSAEGAAVLHNLLSHYS